GNTVCLSLPIDEWLTSLAADLSDPLSRSYKKSPSELVLRSPQTKKDWADQIDQVVKLAHERVSNQREKVGFAMAKKKVAIVPLWQALVDRGFFEDRKTATSWILSGKVLVNGQRGNTAGELIREDAEIYVKGIDLKYVGKGGLKLEGALADFKIDVTGKVSLDAGASTGGFTDCLLQHGASKVYAIDVGYGQLAGRLRQDKRVVNMERT